MSFKQFGGWLYGLSKFTKFKQKYRREFLIILNMNTVAPVHINTGPVKNDFTLKVESLNSMHINKI